jgi:hypothetical protein
VARKCEKMSIWVAGMQFRTTRPRTEKREKKNKHPVKAE